jgi:hypothetical protein
MAHSRPTYEFSCGESALEEYHSALAQQAAMIHGTYAEELDEEMDSWYDDDDV